MLKRENVTERELKLLEELRRIGQALPFGEAILEAHYQDGVIVHMNVENRRESLKF